MHGGVQAGDDVAEHTQNPERYDPNDAREHEIEDGRQHPALQQLAEARDKEAGQGGNDIPG